MCSYTYYVYVIGTLTTKSIKVHYYVSTKLLMMARVRIVTRSGTDL